MTLKAGDVFEETFEILGCLGEGGMGTVYSARQSKSDRLIALKVVHELLIRDKEHVKRFRREAQALSKLRHKHIVTFYLLGFTATGVPYAVMEYLPGKSLSRILNDENYLSSERCIKVMKQVCDAIAYAHHAGIMHRDLKPANIVLQDSPEPDFVKVVDFGLAKLTESSGMSTEKLTETGLLIGSYYYMSPEQVRGFPVDARSDVYACGCIMYECLTGQRPFDADSPIGVLHKHCTEQPLRFTQTEYGGDAFEKLERVCRMAMAKDPECRYQTMLQMIEDLEVIESGKGQLLAQAISDDGEEKKPPRPVTLKSRGIKTKTKKNPLILFVASVSTLSLSALLVWGLLGFRLPTETDLIRAALQMPDGVKFTPWTELEANQSGPTVKGWFLLQDNPHTGEWKVYLSEKGIVSMNQRMGCTLVAAAPDWNIVMFNDKTKTYFLSPFTEWKGAQSSLKSSAKTRQAYSRATSSLIEKTPKLLKEETILGHHANLYLTDNLVTTGLKKVEFSITPDIQVPIQLQQIFAKIYGFGLTKLHGLPLKVSYIDENGKRSPVFDTRSIRTQNIPLKYFSYPTTYKRVDSEIAVLMDQKGREAMAAIMDGQGEGDGGAELDELLGESKPVKDQPVMRTENLLDELAPDPD